MSVPKKKAKKKSSDLCTKGGERRRFLKTQEAVLHSEEGGRRKTGDKGHETEGDCWRICVHLNPEREKVTDSHRNFQLFFFFFFFRLTDHTSVRYALPLHIHPLGLWQHCERCFKEPQCGGGGDGWRRRVGAFSHPRVKYQLCEHTHCAYLLAYAH